MGQHTSKAKGPRTAEHYAEVFGKQLRAMRDQGKLPGFLYGEAFPEMHEGSYRAYNETYKITPKLAEFQQGLREYVDPKLGNLTLSGHADVIRASIGNGTPEELEVARKMALFAMYRKHVGEEALAAEIRKMK